MRWFADLAERLVDNGWPAPLPLRRGSKAPIITNWQIYGSIAVDQPTLERWVADYPDAGLGHAVGHGLAWIDQDEDDPARAARLDGLVRETLGDTPARRVGRPPRSVLVYRRAAGSSMLSALAAVSGCAVYLSGGQIALFGQHPLTGKPYTWPMESPASLGPAELPEITDAQLQQLLEAGALLLPGPVTAKLGILAI
jgi:hypothetical protein